MMKRLSALLLIVALVVTSIFVIPASAETATADASFEIEFLKAIGIFDENFNTNVPVTRGTYANYVARLMGSVSPSTSASVVYVDVKPEDPNCAGISLLTSHGILNGYGDGTFLPERPVTLNEAVKPLVDMLGYKYRANLNGGYPNGYMIAAQDLGLFKGIEIKSGYMYGDDFAKLLYNALDVDVLFENGIIKKDGETSSMMESVEGKTLLTENLDMYIEEGVVNANYVTSISGDVVAENQLNIGGTVVTTTDAKYFDMVGCYVEYVYYQKDNTKEKVLVYAQPEKGSTLTLTKETLISVDGFDVQYSDENGKIKKAKLSGEVDFIYNGDVVIFDQDYIDTFNVGTIRLVNSDGDSDYDVFFIENYTSFVVDSVNSTQKKADSSVQLGYSLSLDPDNYGIMHLVNSAGNAASFEDVNKGTVLSYYVNGNYLKAIVSKEMGEGEIESIRTGAMGTEYTVGGKVYKESPLYAANTAEVGDIVTVYVDAFGYIADIKLGFNDNLQVGFLLKGARDYNGLNKAYGFKIYTPNDKVLVVYAADKVSYNGTSTKMEDLPATLSQSIICYQLNEEGNLNVLETPVPRDENYEDGRLMAIYPKTESSPYYSNMIDSRIVKDGTTVVFSIADVEGDITESMIKSTPTALTDRESYTLEGFAVSKEAPRLKALIKYGEVSDIIPRGENLATVVKFEQVLGEDGMDEYKMDVLVEGIEKSFNVADDVTGVAGPTDFLPGDTFRYGTNSDGAIDKVDRMYRVEEGWLPGSYEYFPVEGITETVMHYGEVLSNDGAYLRVKFDDTPYTGFIQDYYAIPMSHYTAATVVTISGRGCTVTKGRIQDANVGDMVINYRNLMAAVGFVVIKFE